MSQLLEGYKEFREGRLSVVKARELEMVALERGTSLLEVGFGRGEFLYHCARRGAKVAGIDYSRDAYEIAKELFREYPDADIRVADCRDLPFPDESFERVFSAQPRPTRIAATLHAESRPARHDRMAARRATPRVASGTHPPPMRETHCACDP